METEGYIFGAPEAARIADAVRTIEREPTQVGPTKTQRRSYPPTRWTIKLTGFEDGGGKYTADIMTAPEIDCEPATDLTEEEIGTEHTAAYGTVVVINRCELDRGPIHLLAIGSIWQGDLIRRQDDLTVIGIDAIPDTVVIGVNVETDGGAAGSDSTTCDFTYKATAIGSGDEIGTEMIPVMNVRLPNVAYTSATSGFGYFSGGGFALLQVNEVPEAEDCD